MNYPEEEFINCPNKETCFTITQGDILFHETLVRIMKDENAIALGDDWLAFMPASVNYSVEMNIAFLFPKKCLLRRMNNHASSNNPSLVDSSDHKKCQFKKYYKIMTAENNELCLCIINVISLNGQDKLEVTKIYANSSFFCYEIPPETSSIFLNVLGEDVSRNIMSFLSPCASQSSNPWTNIISLHDNVGGRVVYRFENHSKTSQRNFLTISEKDEIELKIAKAAPNTYLKHKLSVVLHNSGTNLFYMKRNRNIQKGNKFGWCVEEKIWDIMSEFTCDNKILHDHLFQAKKPLSKNVLNEMCSLNMTRAQYHKMYYMTSALKRLNYQRSSLLIEKYPSLLKKVIQINNNPSIIECADPRKEYKKLKISHDVNISVKRKLIKEINFDTMRLPKKEKRRLISEGKALKKGLMIEINQMKLDYQEKKRNMKMLQKEFLSIKELVLYGKKETPKIEHYLDMNDIRNVENNNKCLDVLRDFCRDKKIVPRTLAKTIIVEKDILKELELIDDKIIMAKTEFVFSNGRTIRASSLAHKLYWRKINAKSYHRRAEIIEKQNLLAKLEIEYAGYNKTCIRNILSPWGTYAHKVFKRTFSVRASDLESHAQNMLKKWKDARDKKEKEEMLIKLEIRVAKEKARKEEKKKMLEEVDGAKLKEAVKNLVIKPSRSLKKKIYRDPSPRRARISKDETAEKYLERLEKRFLEGRMNEKTDYQELLEYKNSNGELFNREDRKAVKRRIKKIAIIMNTVNLRFFRLKMTEEESKLNSKFYNYLKLYKDIEYADTDSGDEIH